MLMLAGRLPNSKIDRKLSTIRWLVDGTWNVLFLILVTIRHFIKIFEVMQC